MIPHEGHDDAPDDFLPGCPACEAERRIDLEDVEAIAGMAVAYKERE